MENAIYTLYRCPMRDLRLVTPEEMWSARKPCIAHIHVYRIVAYAMVSNEKNGKLNVKTKSNACSSDNAKV